MIIATAMVGSENGTRARAPATKGLLKRFLFAGPGG
jgi:hypothetical protein